MSKLVASIADAVRACGLRDGMTVSFHHHLRNGDFVLNSVLEEIARQGLRDITVNASAFFDVHAPLIGHIRSGVVTGLECAYMDGRLGKAVTEGVLARPAFFRSHGGRPADLARGSSKIDVAFLAAPAADCMGNCSGKYGPSACGSLGYAFADAEHAGKVVVVTDNLVPYPLAGFSIPETQVDYVVRVERIGDPAGIVSGTTRVTRDPVGLLIAEYAARVIRHSGLLRDGFSFQTGAGGASLAVANSLKKIMLEEKVSGSFGMGGVTGSLVDLLEAGCFQTLMDVQCFDLRAVKSIRKNPAHREVSAAHYASPAARSSLVDSLDAVLLGATQIDTDFNVNVHTDSRGYIMGGSGGHSDTAAGAKLSIIIAPLVRGRLSVVVDRVLCTTTPGNTVDVLVTQRGVAVNPARPELRDRLGEAGLPVAGIHDLHRIALSLTGEPAPLPAGGRPVAEILYRDGAKLDEIRMR